MASDMVPILCKYSAIKPDGVEVCRCEGVCWGDQEDIEHPAEEDPRIQRDVLGGLK